MTLVYADQALMHSYLSLLLDPALSSEVPRPPGKVPSFTGKSPTPKHPAKEFEEFLVFLYRKCPEQTCFHSPLLSVLSSASLPLSSEFFTFFNKVTSDLTANRNQNKLKEFIKEGGARVVFEHLCRFHSLSHPSLAVSHTLTSAGMTQRSPDSSHLINYLPLAELRLLPGHTHLHDLQTPTQVAPPSRSSSFQHTFQPQDQQVTISACLPHPFLLCCVELHQPLGHAQSGPSSTLIEISTHPDLAPPIPATPSLPTAGLSSFKAELCPPVVAREVRVHLRRPIVSDSIFLSHLFLWGTSYEGGSVQEGEGECPCSLSGWLEVVDKWLVSSETELLEAAVGVPQLVPTYLSLVTNPHLS